MEVSLTLSAAEFNPDWQTAFLAGVTSVASVAGVSVSKVEITKFCKVATNVKVRPSSANQVHKNPLTCRGAIHRATDTSSARSDSHF